MDSYTKMLENLKTWLSPFSPSDAGTSQGSAKPSKDSRFRLTIPPSIRAELPVHPSIDDLNRLNVTLNMGNASTRTTIMVQGVNFLRILLTKTILDKLETLTPHTDPPPPCTHSHSMEESNALFAMLDSQTKAAVIKAVPLCGVEKTQHLHSKSAPSTPERSTDARPVAVTTPVPAPPAVELPGAPGPTPSSSNAAPAPLGTTSVSLASEPQHSPPRLSEARSCFFSAHGSVRKA